MSVDGVINSGNSRSFTIEAYVPYELFGITNPTEAYLAFDYQRPLNATNKAPNVYSVGKVDRNNVKSLIKVDANGFVSGGCEIKRLLGGSVTINGKVLNSSDHFTINENGTEVVTKDVNPIDPIWFTDITSNCAVIEFTTECLLDTTQLPSTSCETEATIGIIYSNGTKSSSASFFGRSGRTMANTTVWNWSTSVKDYLNVLPKNLSSYGVVQKIVAIYNGSVWYMFYENGGTYTLAYTSTTNFNPVTGKCAFGIMVGTSKQYTRIKIKDVSINVDVSYVNSKLTELRGY
jgi:hypothetical protein